MNRYLLVSIAAGLLATGVVAQERGAPAPQFAPVQAPPPMDEADAPPANPPPIHTNLAPSNGGVKTVPLANSDAEAYAAAEAARRQAAAPIPVVPPQPEKKFISPGLPPDVQKAAEATELPVVTVRQEGNETIEEYYKRGKLFAQRIIPKDGGPTKWYVDNTGSGQMIATDGPGTPASVTQPVQYRLFEWK